VADPTKTQLMNRTLDDMKTLVKEEIRDVAGDMKEELAEAGVAGLLWGVGGLLAVGGIAALLVSVGLKLSGVKAGGTFGVSLGLIGVASGCIAAGYRALPKDALEKLGAELRQDAAETLA